MKWVLAVIWFLGATMWTGLFLSTEVMEIVFGLLALLAWGTGALVLALGPERRTVRLLGGVLAGTYLLAVVAWFAAESANDQVDYPDIAITSLSALLVGGTLALLWRMARRGPALDTEPQPQARP